MAGRNETVSYTFLTITHLRSYEMQAKKKRIPKVAWALLTIVFAIVVFLVIWLFASPKISIENYYPTEGGMGSFVMIELNRDVPQSDLQVFYSDVQIPFTQVAEKVIGFTIPLDASSDEIKVAYKRSKATAPFTVLNESKVELGREELSPSPYLQTISVCEDISVTLPGSFLQNKKLLTVSQVEHPAVTQEHPFEHQKVYDISIDGLTQLDDTIEIAMKYDPAWFDPEVPLEEQLDAVRWDKETGVWVNLYYRIDEDAQTVHMLTDHLSFFTLSLKSVSILGLGKTAAIVGGLAYASEWLANDVYISQGGNIRILYSKKGIYKMFPDQDWENVMKNGNLELPMGYRHIYPFMVQDIGNILEKSLAAYIKAGFDDPTSKSFLGVGYQRRVKVKIDSYWNFYGSGEFNHSSIWDLINVPTEIVKIEFFNTVQNDASAYNKAETWLTHILAHELFHSFQVPYYGMFTEWSKGSHLWWMEATADYASNDIAWGRNTTVLNTRIGNKFFAYPLNTLGSKALTYKGDRLDYEYLSAIFVRFLVQQKNSYPKDLIQYVAKAGKGTEPLLAIKNYVQERLGYTMDASDHPLDKIYGEFVLWMLKNTDFQLADFDDPANTNVVADKQQMISIPEEKATIVLKKEEMGQGNIFVCKGSSNLTSSRDVSSPLVNIKEAGKEIKIDVQDGDILYFVAPNGTELERKATTTITYLPKDGSEKKMLASYVFEVGKDCTAKVWAVKVSVGDWSIDPEQIEEGKLNEEYIFTIKGSSIAKGISEVRLEYDFGDGGKDAKGSVRARVSSSGTVEVEIPYTFLPSEKTQKNEDLIVTVKVDIFAGESSLGSVSAIVALTPIQVTILPPRLMTYELAAGATEVEHPFKASASEEGEYIFEWNFGDGSPLERTQGNTSSISHIYREKKTYYPEVTLYDLEGTLLAKDSITIFVEDGGESEYVWVLVKIVDDQGEKPLQYTSPDTLGVMAHGVATYQRGNHVFAVTHSKEPESDFTTQVSWTPPPQTLVPSQETSLNFSVNVLRDAPGYSRFGTKVSATFIRYWPGDEGPYKIRPGGGSFAGSYHFLDSFEDADGTWEVEYNQIHSDYMAQTKTFSASIPEVDYTLNEDRNAQMGILVSSYAGAGDWYFKTYYIYELQSISTSTKELDTEGIDGIEDIKDEDMEEYKRELEKRLRENP
jgi:hypothetical protein